MPIKIKGEREGRPDYSTDVKPKESVPVLTMQIPRPPAQTKVFARTFSDISSLWVHVTTPLPAGTEIVLIDMVTGLAMPYTVKVGEWLAIKGMVYTSDQPFRYATWIDGEHSCLWVCKSHLVGQVSLPVQFDTRFIDPKCERQHTIELRIKNL